MAHCGSFLVHSKIRMIWTEPEEQSHFKQQSRELISKTPANEENRGLYRMNRHSQGIMASRHARDEFDEQWKEEKEEP